MIWSTKISILLVLSLVFVVSEAYEYHVGVGIADITGPAAEVGMVKISKCPKSGKIWISVNLGH